MSFAAALLFALVQTSPPIIIEGRRPATEKEALRAVTDMTVITDSQIARFHDPVCPLVLGMQRDAAARVEQRIRHVVNQVGAQEASERCEANLLVLITDEPSELIRDIQTKRPRWFDGVNPSEKRRLLHDAPARSWSVTTVRNEDGGRPGIGEMLGRTRVETTSYSMMVRGASALDNIPQLRVRSNSMTRASSRQHLDGSVVVIDAGAAEGLTLRQIADYSAMRGLAKVHPPENVAQLNSILAVVEKSPSAPKELTAFDWRYLGELYEHLDNKGFDRSVWERTRMAQAIAGE